MDISITTGQHPILAFVAAIGPWLATVGAVSVGAWQFLRQQKEAHEELLLQQAEANKRPFLEKQLAVCIEATDVVARLATETDPQEWEKARRTFWRLYWGRLALVEDRAVEACMVKFSRKIPAEPIVSHRLPLAELQDSAIDLAYAARQLILRSWNITLPRLENEGGEGE